MDKEPALRTKNGVSFAFSPEWYPDLVKMCNSSLDMFGFGPEMGRSTPPTKREDPPPSDIDVCDWDGLSSSFMT